MTWDLKIGRYKPRALKIGRGGHGDTRQTDSGSQRHRDMETDQQSYHGHTKHRLRDTTYRDMETFPEMDSWGHEAESYD